MVRIPSSTFSRRLLILANAPSLLLRFLCLHEAAILALLLRFFWPDFDRFLRMFLRLHFSDCRSGTLFSLRWSAMEYRRCQPPCSGFIASHDLHSKCVKCMGFSHACEAVFGISKCKFCIRLSSSCSGGLCGLPWIHDLGLGCGAPGDGERADGPRPFSPTLKCARIRQLNSRMNIYILARRHATPFERQSVLWWRSSGLPSHSQLPSGSLCLGGQGTPLTPPLPLCPESAPCRERSPPSGAALRLIPLRPFWGAHFPTVDLAGGLTKSTRCIVLGSPHSSVWLHTSVWLQSPPLRRGSPDSSKQHLKGFCATAGTVLLPPQRGNRGSPSIGPGTRLFPAAISLCQREMAVYDPF